MMTDTSQSGSYVAEPASLIDTAVLEVLRRDVGIDRIGLAFQAFSDELARRRSGLEAALAADDLVLLARETHALKGSALTFGARALGLMAWRADDASRAGEAVVATVAAKCALELIDETLEAVDGLITRTAEERGR